MIAAFFFILILMIGTSFIPEFQKGSPSAQAFPGDQPEESLHLFWEHPVEDHLWADPSERH